MSQINITAATFEDIDYFYDFLMQHSLESNHNHGFFRPSDQPWKESRTDFKMAKTLKWQHGVTQVGWEKVWLAWDPSIIGLPPIVGYILLKHDAALTTTLHRATLQMGILQDFRGKKIGQKLLKNAICWCQYQPSISWIDLQVFAANTAALALYQKNNFLAVGKIVDAYRIQSISLDEIYMTLNLKS